jgi:hypothetical protein
LASATQSAEFGQTVDATVCTSSPYNALAAATTIFNDSIEFYCGNKQKGTIPGFSKMGWHIVSIQTQQESSPVNPKPKNVTILILGKPPNNRRQEK